MKRTMIKATAILSASVLLLAGCGTTGGASKGTTSDATGSASPASLAENADSRETDSGLASGGSSADEPEEIPGLLQVSTEEAARMLEEETGYILVDARPAEDFRKSHIPGSINIPDETVDKEPPAELPDKDQRIFLYCGGGGLSYYLAVKLHDMGYTNLVKFAGMKEWTGPVEGEEVSESVPDSGSDSISDSASGKIPGSGSESVPGSLSESEPAEAIQPVLVLDASRPGEKDGVSMKVTGFVRGESLKAVLVNNSSEVFEYGMNYVLERKNGEEWEMVPGMDEMSFIMIAIGLPSKSTEEITCDISPLTLEAGEYRLTKSGITAEFSLVYTE